MGWRRRVSVVASLALALASSPPSALAAAHHTGARHLSPSGLHRTGGGGTIPCSTIHPSALGVAGSQVVAQMAAQPVARATSAGMVAGPATPRATLPREVVARAADVTVNVGLAPVDVAVDT